MKEIILKYGCNPNQDFAKIFMKDETKLPLKVLSGRPGYINFLDALNAWQLVKELKAATGICAAASFKHTSPAGVAIGKPLDKNLKKVYWIDDIKLSPLACAYIRARGADRMSSFGDFIGLSDICDESTAKIIRSEVSDGVIAPGYTKEALEILKEKRNGNYNIIEIDERYTPNKFEEKQIFGISFLQKRNSSEINTSLFKNIVTENKNLPESIVNDLLIALITLKYTQSNSVCYVKDGQTIGIGAGQQSRIHCTRLAGNKADNWYLRQSKNVLELDFKTEIKKVERDNIIDSYINDDCIKDFLEEGNWQNIFNKKPRAFLSEEKLSYLKGLKNVILGSDAFFPFSDNIERAKASGVEYIIQPGGSLRDKEVIKKCNEYNMLMIFTGLRLFYH